MDAAPEKEEVQRDPIRSARLTTASSLAISLIATLAVHVGLAWMLHRQDNVQRDPIRELPRSPAQLCGDRRCPSPEVPLPRRGIDIGPPPDVQTIEVAVIAALGYKEPIPRELPRLVKYEQRRKVQAGINIDKKNEKPKEVENKQNKPKEAELDKRRKKEQTLDDILDAPEDDDPRKRATALDKIVGQKDGSVHGTDPRSMKGHPALTRLQGALQSEMAAPQMIPADALRKLKTRVRLQLDYTGAIRKFSIIKTSGNKHFDTAVRQAVQRFMPSSGGSRRLPAIPDPIRNAINGGKVNFVFDGARLRR